MTPVDLGLNPNQYVTGIKWQPDNKALYVQRLNRTQTKLDLLRAEIKTGNTKIVFTETKPDYIKVQANNIYFLPSRNSFLWLSEDSGYNQIYEVNLATAKKINTYLMEGLDWFKGIYKYAEVLLHTAENFSIAFTDKERLFKTLDPGFFAFSDFRECFLKLAVVL